MTKKKIMMAAMSAGLVAVVGIGGTLAYLSSTSNEVTNTFTVGRGYDNTGTQALVVDEWELGGTADDRTQVGQAHEDMTPGYVETKDPTVRLKNGSVESYVFVRVEGVDELEGITANGIEGTPIQAFDISGWDTDYWMKVADANGDLLDTPALGLEGDGYYVANVGNTVNLEDTTPEGEYTQLNDPIFSTISMDKDLKEMPAKNTVAAQEITVKACAVQYSEDQMSSWADAFESAVWE